VTVNSSLGRTGMRCALAVSVLLGFAMAVPAFAAGVTAAQTTASLSGRVQTPDGQPVAGAQVTVDGAGRAATISGNDGRFAFPNLAAGLYALRVSKAGFAWLERDDVLVGDANVSFDVALSPSSFSSLQTIGRVSTNVPGKISLNTTTAAVDVISAQAFADQGSLQVTKLLEEAPGVSLTSNAAGGGSNHASLGAPEYPQLRGALPYETESLIDGHAASVGAIGTFSPLLILPALLQNIEIAKGPGSMPAEINYAVGGTVNYRTLEPTRKPEFAAELGGDRYGGIDTSLRATGSLANHRIDYAFAYATLGTPGPLQNYPAASSQVFLAFGAQPWTINGHQLPGSPAFEVLAPTQQYAGGAAIRFAEPLYLCCTPVNTGFNTRGELGKLRFNFSEQTALTVSYLGGQSADNFSGTILGSGTPLLNYSTFVPPAGYTGSIAPGTSIPFDTQANTAYSEYLQQNLFQGELRSSIGATTLLARAYSGFDSTLAQEYTPGQTLSVTENAWGGIALCPLGTTAHGATCLGAGGATVAPVTSFFNGQPVTLTTFSPATYTQLIDSVYGYSLEADRPVGAALVSLAVDRSNHSSDEFALGAGTTATQVVLPPGSGQQFTTVLARAQLPVAARLSATFSTYFTSYASHYTGDGGVTWHDATHATTLPRLAFSWRPNPDVAWRFATGGSIAPPYISLLSSPGTTPVHDPPGQAQGYFINANNGQIAPETAFGYDLGVDWRIRPALRFSSDLYLTNLRDMFLTQTSQQGTFTPASGASVGVTEPLYVTETGNLGNARYEGIELALDQAPLRGFGFKLQGSLQRAFAYNISPALYSTTSGPNTTNLGVIPNINFQASGSGFNAISPGRIPYSQGYAEVNFRTAAASLFLLGYTYFGPNNAFNQPAFGVVSASVRVPLWKDGYVQLSGDNLTDVYGQPYGALLGGVPVPLINGKLGVIAASNYGPTTLQLSLHQVIR
jgi:outer membrane receptor protein involved in Fe transport